MIPFYGYPKNGFGLHGMSGNVWEWANDWYNTDYYGEPAHKESVSQNPKGATKAFNPVGEKVIKGGSFLCQL